MDRTGSLLGDRVNNSNCERDRFMKSLARFVSSSSVVTFPDNHNIRPATMSIAANIAKCSAEVTLAPEWPALSYQLQKRRRKQLANRIQR